MVRLDVVEAGLDAALFDDQRTLEVAPEVLGLGALALAVLRRQSTQIVVQLCCERSCCALLV